MTQFVEGFGLVLFFFGVGFGISAVLTVIRSGGRISE